MYTVYVLHSSRYSKIYIGCTTNLSQRLRSHNELSKRGWTVRYRPWELVYFERYTDKGVALRRERELKSAAGRRFIWGLIRKKGTHDES